MRLKQTKQTNNRFESNYSSIKKSGILFKNAAKQKGFSLLHCNTRSLGKNVSLLHDILLTVETRPDIIAISETKINENSYANINLPGYNFVNTNSKSQAGGVGLYIANNIEFSRKTDLDISRDGIESCWVELACHKQKNIVIGCVYRHPKSDRSLFHETLKKQLESLNNSPNRDSEWATWVISWAAAKHNKYNGRPRKLFSTLFQLPAPARACSLPGTRLLH